MRYLVRIIRPYPSLEERFGLTPSAIPNQRHKVLMQAIFSDATPGTGTEGALAGDVLFVSN